MSVLLQCLHQGGHLVLGRSVPEKLALAHAGDGGGLFGYRAAAAAAALGDFADEVGGNHHPLNLIGALVDGGDLGVAVHPLHVHTFEETSAAEDLHRVVGDLQGNVRGVHLGHGGLHAVGLVVLLQLGGGVDEEPGAAQLGGHVRQLEGQGLLGGDGLAELNPLLGVLHIEFEHVNFSYAGEGGNLSLKDVNLHIKSGQIVGIIGGTGSAKSTLVQLIPRLYDVTSGTVKVGGTDVRDYNLKALRDQVSVVLQKNVLFTGSIYENIRWGDETASDAEVERVCKLAQADGFIREFPNQYETMIVEGGNNVSGGQKQRLCIARALLKKPKILILDDSTSAVDTKTDALIRQAFREEIPDTTRIIIAQRVSSVEDADVIIVMDKGEISGIGTSEELLKTNAIYREVYESQMKGGKDSE